MANAYDLGGQADRRNAQLPACKGCGKCLEPGCSLPAGHNGWHMTATRVSERVPPGDLIIEHSFGKPAYVFPDAPVVPHPPVVPPQTVGYLDWLREKQDEAIASWGKTMDERCWGIDPSLPFSHTHTVLRYKSSWWTRLKHKPGYWLQCVHEKLAEWFPEFIKDPWRDYE